MPKIDDSDSSITDFQNKLDEKWASEVSKWGWVKTGDYYICKGNCPNCGHLMIIPYPIIVPATEEEDPEYVAATCTCEEGHSTDTAIRGCGCYGPVKFRNNTR